MADFGPEAPQASCSADLMSQGLLEGIDGGDSEQMSQSASASMLSSLLLSNSPQPFPLRQSASLDHLSLLDVKERRKRSNSEDGQVRIGPGGEGLSDVQIRRYASYDMGPTCERADGVRRRVSTASYEVTTTRDRCERFSPCDVHTADPPARRAS